MVIEESDARILRSITRRLLAESRSVFHEAHLLGMESFSAPTRDEQFEMLDKAIRQERRAIAIQEEAIELQRQAIMSNVHRLARLKRVARW